MPISVPKINQLTFLMDDRVKAPHLLPIGTKVKILSKEQLLTAKNPIRSIIIVEPMYNYAGIYDTIMRVVDEHRLWYKLQIAAPYFWVSEWFTVLSTPRFKLTGMSQIDTRYQALMEQQLTRKIKGK